MSIKNELQITILEGPAKGKKYIFTKERITLGRSEDCDIIFSDKDSEGISRVHAIIEWKDNGWKLIDKSTNGTYYFDNKILKKSSRFLMEKEIIRLSKKGIRLRIVLISDNRIQAENEKSIVFEGGRSLNDPSLTKIMPLYRKGESKRLRSNPFFVPGIVTVIAGILMFALFQSIAKTNNKNFINLYELLLGVYLGSGIIYAVVKVIGIDVKKKFLIVPAFFTAFTMFISLTFLTPIFRMPFVMSFMESHNVIIAFIGHFIGAGLLEELIKSIPVWIILIFSEKFSRDNNGFKNGKLLPSLAVVIASSSAVGFIIIETVMQYVPMVQQHSSANMGLMLLFPRFITGISGHVAWSGLFAYFISLSHNYRNKKVMLVFIGWFSAASLHGLWNAFAMAQMPFADAVVALSSFILFFVYINNTKYFE